MKAVRACYGHRRHSRLSCNCFEIREDDHAHAQLVPPSACCVVRTFTNLLLDENYKIDRLTYGVLGFWGFGPNEKFLNCGIC